MPCLWQARSKGWRRQVAVGPERFFGKSANWMPLSVRTTLVLYPRRLVLAGECDFGRQRSD
jgi:hypothetical protein